MNFRVTIYFDENDKPDVEGKIDIKRKKNFFRFYDGWTVENVNNSDNYRGYYNILHWFLNEDKITAENDILGYRPLYLYLGIKRVIISDNFWDVIEEIDSYKVDYSAVTQLTNFRRLVPSYKTLVKDVYRLPAGSKLTYSKGESKPKIKYNKKFQQEPDESIDSVKAADQLHKAFLKTFSSIKDRKIQEVWFGNSGGLDSRLIPAYAQKYGIDLNGFIISNKKPKVFLNQSIKSARKIAKYYDFQFLEFNYDEGNGWKRLLHDLYVNPFGPSNFIKNPRYEDFKGKFILNGGNSFVIANDNNFWKSKKANQKPIKSFIDKYFLRNKGDRQLIPDYRSLLEEQVIKILGRDSDSFSKFRTLHQTFLNFTSSAGGFESMNLAGEAQTIHHPFITYTAMNWPEHLFYNRRVQTKLFEKYFPNLLAIPDQNGIVRGEGAINYFTNIFYSKFNIYRTNGLDYNNWLESEWYQNLEQKGVSYISDFNCRLGSNMLKEMEIYSSSKDKMNLLKLSILITHLEKGINPKA